MQLYCYDRDCIKIYAVYTKKLNKSNNILLDDRAEDDYTINLGGYKNSFNPR